MRNVAEYLEALGRDAAFPSVRNRTERLQSLAPAVRVALIAGDAPALRKALGLQAVMACMISAPNEDEKDFEDQPAIPDEQPDDSDVRAA